MIEIFEIEDGKVRINANCLIIPELKAIVDKYIKPLPALNFVYNMSNPMSPYSNLPEADREEIILSEFPGDYSPEDEEIQKAKKKLDALYLTPTRRFFLNAKKGLETLGEYLAVASITEGKDGNFSSFNMALSRVGKTIEEFKKLEKIYEEEAQASMRGGHSASYDE